MDRFLRPVAERRAQAGPRGYRDRRGDPTRTVKSVAGRSDHGQRRNAVWAAAGAPIDIELTGDGHGRAEHRRAEDQERSSRPRRAR